MRKCFITKHAVMRVRVKLTRKAYAYEGEIN